MVRDVGPETSVTAAASNVERVGQERQHRFVGPALHRRGTDAQLQRIAMAPDHRRPTRTGLDPDIEDHSTIHALDHDRTTVTCTGWPSSSAVGGEEPIAPTETDVARVSPAMKA